MWVAVTDYTYDVYRNYLFRCLSQFGVLWKLLGLNWFQPPILHCIVRKFGYGGHFVLNAGLEKKIRHCMSIVATCRLLSSTKADARCNELSWQYLRRPTASLSHWASSSVYSTTPSRGSIYESWYVSLRRVRRHHVGYTAFPTIHSFPQDSWPPWAFSLPSVFCRMHVQYSLHNLLLLAYLSIYEYLTTAILVSTFTLFRMILHAVSLKKHNFCSFLRMCCGFYRHTFNYEAL